MKRLLTTVSCGALLGITFASPAASQAPPTPVPLTTVTVPAGGDVLRTLPAGAAELTFSSEIVNREIPFYLTPLETVGDIKLFLKVQSAVSIAPETSVMRVFVNDVGLQEIELLSGEPRLVQIDVPLGLIQPGFNGLTLLVDQHHRVDCSIESTYELWTSIDPRLSGLRLQGRERSALSLSDLMSLGRTAEGRTSIRARLPRGHETRDLERLLTAVQTLTIAGGFDKPTVEFAEGPGSGPGIDVVVGDRETVASLVSNHAIGTSEQESIALFEDAATGRTTLVVTGRNDSEIELRLRELASMMLDAAPSGVGPGIRALQNLRGVMLEPGQPATLASLGFVSRPFAGRYFRDRINFTMPADFYPGDYGKARLRLSARFAPGLERGAELLIKVNGTTVSTIPLAASRNGVIQDQFLPIPLSHLRPGENVLSFESRLPASVDKACETSALARPSVRLQISGESTFEIPSMAQIGRYPDLAATLTGAGSQNESGIDHVPLTLLMGGTDPDTLNATATVLAKLAYSSGRVYHPEIVRNIPRDGADQLLMIGDYSSFPADVFSMFHVAERTSEAWAQFTSENETLSDAVGYTEQFPNAETLQQLSVDPYALSSNDTLVAPETTREQTLWERLGQPGELTAFGMETAQNIARVTADYGIEISQRAFRQAPEILHYGKDAALVMSQVANPSETGAWTLVAAPDAETLNEMVAKITQRDLWTSINGAGVVFAADGALLDQVDGQRQSLFETQPRSLANGRLILAGWFSKNLDRFATLLFVTSILLGLVTFLYLQTVGGRRR